jgi:hypothetical protein
LRQQDRDPQKELPFDGVYQLSRGKMTLVAKDFVRPNGIACKLELGRCGRKVFLFDCPSSLYRIRLNIAGVRPSLHFSFRVTNFKREQPYIWERN